MARPHGYRRLSRKARHMIRRLRKTKSASVQDMALHELDGEISRRWRPSKARGVPAISPAGIWRPLSRRAQRLLTELRKTKVWRIQQRLVTEIRREIERGRKSRWARIRDSRAVRRAAARIRGGNSWKKVRGFRPAQAADRQQRVREQERPFAATRAGRTWGRRNARREVPGPAVSRIRQQRQSRTAPATDRTAPAPRSRLSPGARPAPARTRS